LSQIVCHELGIDPSHISVRHGDTESTAFGFGTFASRSMVMSGGAVARASRILRDKLCRIGAHLLQCEPGETRCADGIVLGPRGSVSIAEIAKVAHLRMHELPPGVDPLLDATATYEPAISTGVFSYATHGAVVAVDYLGIHSDQGDVAPEYDFAVLGREQSSGQGKYQLNVLVLKFDCSQYVRREGHAGGAGRDRAHLREQRAGVHRE